MDLRASSLLWQPRRAVRIVLALCLVALGLGQLRHHDAGAAGGRFRVQGTQIVDPAGRPFVPLGVNLLGPETWWDRPTKGMSGAVEDWRFNTIRLNVGLPGQSGITTNNDLDGIVDEYTAKGIVVMIEMHAMGNGGYPAGADLATLRAWWVDIANRYKGNTYVWFNLMNEPGSEQQASSQWRTVHEDVTRAIRATGADNLVVLDGAAWGQDAFSWDSAPVATASSAILTYGPAVAAAYPNVAFSLHVYDQWNTSSSKLANYIDRVHGAGLALLIGEVGSVGYVNGAVRDFSAAARAVADVAPSRGVGVLAWHGQGYGGGEGFSLVQGPEGYIDRINSTTNPTNLTSDGSMMWAMSHRPAPAATTPAPAAATTPAPTPSTTVAPAPTTTTPVAPVTTSTTTAPVPVPPVPATTTAVPAVPPTTVSTTTTTATPAVPATTVSTSTTTPKPPPTTTTLKPPPTTTTLKPPPTTTTTTLKPAPTTTTTTTVKATPTTTTTVAPTPVVTKGTPKATGSWSTLVSRWLGRRGLRS